MSPVGRLPALGSAVLLLSVGLGACSSTGSARQTQEQTSCPILRGVDLADAHLSGATFTPAEAANGSTQFKRFKSTGKPLRWPNIDAVSMPTRSGALEIHFHAGDQFGSILCISDRFPTLRDAEALARALLLHSTPS
jgi:hypothetical protein